MSDELTSRLRAIERGEAAPSSAAAEPGPYELHDAAWRLAEVHRRREGVPYHPYSAAWDMRTQGWVTR